VSRATPAKASPRPSGWPARSASRSALTGTIGGLAERLGAPTDFLRLLVVVAAYVQHWVIAAYLMTAIALAAPGERRTGMSGLVVAGRMAALMGLAYLAGFLPGTTAIFDLDGEPSSWIPFGAVAISGLTALLVRRRADRWSPAPHEAVLAAVPIVLAGAGLGLAVVVFPEVRWERWLFVPALIAGVVLLARPRGALARAAIPPAAAFAAVSALMLGAGVRLEGGVGDTTVRPQSAAQVPRELHRAVGDVNLDLTALRGRGERITVDASVGVGTVDVEVPPRTLVELDVRLGQARLSVEDLDARNRRVIGRGVPLDVTRGHAVQPRMRLRLRLRAGAGEIIVNDKTTSTRWTL